MDQNFSLMAQSRANYYTAGSPVQFVRVELLKGDTTGEVAVCLTFKNVGTEPLTGLVVHFKCKDAAGQVLCEDDFYYEQLNAQPGAVFGSDDAVYVSDTPVSSVEVEQDRAFLNGRGVDLRNYKRVRLNMPRVLPGSIAKTLQQRTGNVQLTCVPQDTEYGWFCACGALNRADEEVCHVCGQKLAALLPFDAEALKAEKDKRLQKEADERRRTEEQAKAAAAEKAKKSKKTAMIMTPIICLCIVAIIVFTQVVLPKQKYDKAMELSNAGDYEAALTLLDGLNYKDSAEKRETIYNKWLLINAKVGDTINFGAYEQDDDISNGKEIIEWIVLAKQNNRLFVISRYAIDARPYNAEQKEATWETCSLRQWLNTEFLDSAFSDSEKAMIAAVTVSAEKNPEYITSPGKSTQDKVLLLSIAEAERYFTSNDARACEPTAYAESNGASPAGNGNCWWRLRTPGDSQSCTGEVHCTGVILNTGSDVSFAGVAIRPAMWIDLSD